MLAYHSDPEIKKTYLARVRAHREADNLVKGTGWEDGKGCAIGCTLEAYDHALYETELGIPVILANLEDNIFEGLPNGAAQQFPEAFLDAIVPGADLQGVCDQFLLWLLVDENSGVLKHTKKGSEAHQAINNVAMLFKRHIRGESVSKAEWIDAAYAADDATAEAAADAVATAVYAGQVFYENCCVCCQVCCQGCCVCCQVCCWKCCRVCCEDWGRCRGSLPNHV